ncbi:hypothetical protein XA68_18368 [Ophiocordyceps unilateralis]|uniref:Uncharacterized protein n=1 Tax=Ophiocordyceps unilateralis TaxID=268505 RepID=A0A2A9P3H9_OPHUN|nr:hypothetical protein XA68_18368 [Ophiocordyceps unilateralis]
MVTSQPFMYEYSSRPFPDWRSPATVFDPKAVTRASFEPTPKREKPRWPLISFRQHPDAHELPRQTRPCRSLGSWVQNWFKWLRQIQLALRLLQLTGSTGVLVLMVLMTKVEEATAWVLRITAGISVLHCLYAVHHLARSPIRRPPASSAAYQAFAALADVFILSVCVFGALSTHRNGVAWSTLLSDLSLVRILVPTAYYTLIAASCLHLVTLSISVWLCTVLRKISLMPPDMNPLEEHLTARPYTKISNRLPTTTTASSVEDDGRVSAIWEKKLSPRGDDTTRPPRIPFMITRAGSSSPTAKHSLRTDASNMSVPRKLVQGYPIVPTAGESQYRSYTKLSADDAGWPLRSTESHRANGAGNWPLADSLVGAHVSHCSDETSGSRRLGEEGQRYELSDVALYTVGGPERRGYHVAMVSKQEGRSKGDGHGGKQLRGTWRKDDIPMSYEKPVILGSDRKVSSGTSYGNQPERFRLRVIERKQEQTGGDSTLC